MDAATLVQLCYGQALRSLCLRTERHFEGLAQAARQARRCGLLTNDIVKKLVRLDTAYQVNGQIAEPSVKTLVANLSVLLNVGADALLAPVVLRTSALASMVPTSNDGLPPAVFDMADS